MSDFLNAKTNLGAGTLNVDGIDSKMQEIHDEFSDEDNEQTPLTSNMNEQGLDFSDHELDSCILSVEEQKRAIDSRFTFDFRHFPKAFASVFDAVDTYCELGYSN